MRNLYLFLILFTTGCSSIYTLSEEQLDKDTSKGKILKLGYSELPEAVKDTVRGTFEWFRRVNLQTKSNESSIYYPQMVSLDTNIRFENYAYKGSFEKKTVYGPFYRDGEFFTIGNRKFKIPMVSSQLLRIIYRQKLYLMGDPADVEVSYKESEAHTVQYERFRYWVIDLKEN